MIHIRQVLCSGAEFRLLDCGYSTDTDTECYYYEDSGAICSLGRYYIKLVIHMKFTYVHIVIYMLCLQCGVSWVRVPPMAAHFSLKNCLPWVWCVTLPCCVFDLACLLLLSFLLHLSNTYIIIYNNYIFFSSLC